jgi:hypothetical protein
MPAKGANLPFSRRHPPANRVAALSRGYSQSNHEAWPIRLWILAGGLHNLMLAGAKLEPRPMNSPGVLRIPHVRLNILQIGQPFLWSFSRY